MTLGILSVPSTTLFSGLERSIRRANEICYQWSGGLLSLQSAGTEFILHYEVTRYLAETLNDPFEFDVPPIQTQSPTEGISGLKVTRNAKRRYLVARDPRDGTIAFVRIQRFTCADYFVSEMKGAARAVEKYRKAGAAVLVGVIGPLPDSHPDAVRDAYDRIAATLHTSPPARLNLDLPDEAMQRELGRSPPIMMARVTKAG